MIQVQAPPDIPRTLSTSISSTVLHVRHNLVTSLSPSGVSCLSGSEESMLQLSVGGLLGYGRCRCGQGICEVQEKYLGNLNSASHAMEN
jgi:hypothetical protein